MKNSLFVLIFLIAKLCFGQQVKISVQTGHTSPIKKILFSPDNKWILSLDRENTLVTWDVAQGKQYHVIQHPTETVSDLVFVNDTILAIGYAKPLMRLYNVLTGLLIQDIKTGTEVGGMAKVKNSKTIFFGSDHLCSINLSTGKVERYSIESHGIFSVVKVNDEGTELVVGGRDDRYFYILDLVNAKPSSIQKKFLGNISSADFNTQENKVLVSTFDGKIKSLRKDSSGVSGATTDFPTNSYNDIKLSSNYVFAASLKTGIHVFYGNRWKKLPSLIDNKGSVNALALSSNKQLLAAGGDDYSITVWDVNKQLLLNVIKGKVTRINSVAFTADDNSILIGYADGSFRVSDLITNSSKASHIEASKVSQSLGWTYVVGNIHADKSDSALISLYYLHRSSRKENEVYDNIKVYNAIWETKKANKLSLELNPVPVPTITNYITKLKKNQSPLPYEIYPDSSCIALNRKLNVAISVVRDSVIVNDLFTGKLRYAFNAMHADRISSIAINEEYHLFVTASWDGLIKFWDVKSGNLLVTYGAFGESDFIYLDKQNNYYASKGSLNYIAFSYKGRVFPFDQFDLKFNRPDIVLESLPFISKGQTENFKKAFAKRLSKMKLTEDDLDISTDLPLVSVELPEKLSTKDGAFTFKVKASENKSELASLFVFVNGVPEYGKDGMKISGKNHETEIKLQLNPGHNTIQVFTTNAKRQSSLKETFGVFNSAAKRKPELYLVLIGVSEYDQEKYNLKYASKDAFDVGEYMKKDKAFSKINTKLILNKEARLENFKAVSEFLSPAQVDDVVMILLAGHGVLDQNLDYYLASSNMDFENPSGKGISYETMDQLLENTKCRNRIMFLDACHSGEVDKEEVKVVENTALSEGIAFRAGGTGLANIDKFNSFELAKSVFADFRANNGAWVISSAGATEYAIEGGKWKNGVFTYALLKGLSSGEADLNGDDRIMISELQRYLTNEVAESTKGKQKPNVRNENLFNDIRIK